MATVNTKSSSDTTEKARVLIADDSKIVRVSASRMLKNAFDVVLAEDGEDAWKKICDDNSIRVVFTDIGMPNLDGYGLIQRIRQSEDEGIRNQPVIVITGAAEDEDVKRKVFELGATDFITKPFKSTEVIARAEAHINYRRNNDKLKEHIEVDLLTGTLNRAGFVKQLAKDVAFVNRHSENIALIRFELDCYKTLYESVGKKTSDNIVKQVAKTMLQSVRKEDSVGRYSSDQFLISIPMAKSDGVITLAKRLCEMVKACSIRNGGEDLSVTMSAGVATAVNDIRATEQELITSSDQALSLAKKIGPGEVQIVKLEGEKTSNTLAVISIDSMLESLNKERAEITDKQLEGAIEQLIPLIKLMSEQQIKRLLG